MKTIVNLPDKYYQKILAYAEEEGYGSVEEFIAELARQYIRSAPVQKASISPVTQQSIVSTPDPNLIPLTPELETLLNKAKQEYQSITPSKSEPPLEFPTDNPHEHEEVETEPSVSLPSVTPPLIRKKKGGKDLQADEDSIYKNLGGKCQIAQIFNGVIPCLSVASKSYSIANATVKNPSPNDFKRVHLCEIHSQGLLQSQAYLIK